MISLFRKIRRKLALENKFAQYSRYAIGEILLVVIGILIALAINNWNEQQKNHKKEAYIITNLNSEFTQNLALLDSLCTKLEHIEQSNLALMTYMNKDIEVSTIKTIDSLLYWSIEHNQYTPNNNTFTEIMNTGKIELIRNNKLKSNLFEWSRALKGNNATYLLFQQWTENWIVPYLSKHIALKNIDNYGNLSWEDGSQFESGIPEILKDREFENIIDNNIYHLVKIKKEFYQIRELIKSIIKETS